MLGAVSTPTYAFVDRPDSMAGALATLADLDPVGVDVERADWNRYYRAAALLQVGGAGTVVIIDPMVVEDLADLAAFVGERTVLLHALENDVGPLASLGIELGTIHDTAIAAALLGLPTGLETLLKEVLGIEVGWDKSRMQRANWEQRPLTEEMLAYAAGDVADLPALWEALQRQLRERDRWGWYVEELEARLVQPPVEDRRDWTRIRGVGRLDPRARARARALWEAREELAQSSDTAPGRIVNDKVLLDLAGRPPGGTRDLGRRGVRRQSVRSFGQDIVEALRVGDLLPPEPPPRYGRRAGDADRDLAERLRAVRADIADEVGLDPGLLCPSRHLLRAVLSDPASSDELRDALGLRRWQWELLASRFTETVFGKEDGHG